MLTRLRVNSLDAPADRLALVVHVVQRAVLRLAGAEEVRHVSSEDQLAGFLLRLRGTVDGAEADDGEDDGQERPDSQNSAHWNSPLDAENSTSNWPGRGARKAVGYTRKFLPR